MPRVLRPVPVREEIPLYKRISWWIENTIVRSFKVWLNDAADTIRDILNLGVTDFVEDTERDFIDVIRPLAQELLNAPGLPESVKGPLREALTGAHQGGVIILVGLVLAAGNMLAQAAFSPVAREIAQQTDRLFRSHLFDPSTLVVLRTRGLISDSQFDQLMALNGVTDDAKAALLGLGRPLFSQDELARLLWRDRMTPGAVDAELEHYGYNAAQRGMLRDLMTVIPGPPDLISMAVREAFDDGIAARFGYDENYPGEAASWAERSGLGQEWFKRYWRAHWNLPGLVQVREMYNRGIISDGDLDAYLRAADLPAFWRGKLVRWAKAEITRVDVRRIYKLGLISTAEVYDRYLKLGYTEEDSALMTQWTAAEYMEADRELTKTDILGMYEDAILNGEEATAYLEALGYRGEEVNLLLAQRDLHRQEKFERQVMGYVEKLYVAGTYTRTDVFQELGKLDAPGAFIDQSLQVWDLERKAKVLIPTTTQLRDLAQEGIISRERFREEMGKRGYGAEYIEWYERLWLEV